MQADPEKDGEHWIWHLVREHQGPLILYTERILGDPERARDVVQEAFLELCRLQRDGRPDSPRRWLFTVCRNRAFDVRKKEQRMTTLEESQAERRASGEPAPGARLEREECAGAALALLGALPENQREVLRLKFQAGLSYREIAGVTRLSVGNVGFLIHQGLKTLRERLSGERREELLS